MKKTKYFLALLAAVIVLTTGIGQAMAYFTTYTEAKGYNTIKLGDETTITEEELRDWTKILTITNEKGSEPVFVRAKVFYAPSTNKPDVEGTGWSTTPPGGELTQVDYAKNEGDGNSTPYYYYQNTVAGEESAEPLNVKIGNIIPADVVKGDTFNVIVIYESTPVLYDADGNSYANWTSKLVVTHEIESTPNT